jgi:hypothetical protein
VRGLGQKEQTVGAWQREVTPGFPYRLHPTPLRLPVPRGLHTPKTREREAHLQRGCAAEVPPWRREDPGRTVAPAVVGCGPRALWLQHRAASGRARCPSRLRAPGSGSRPRGPTLPALGPGAVAQPQRRGPLPRAARALFVFLARLT